LGEKLFGVLINGEIIKCGVFINMPVLKDRPEEGAAVKMIDKL